MGYSITAYYYSKAYAERGMTEPSHATKQKDHYPRTHEVKEPPVEHAINFYKRVPESQD